MRQTLSGTAIQNAANTTRRAFSCFSSAPGRPTPAARRPLAIASGANARAFPGIPIGPDVAPLVQATQLRVPSADQRRQRDASGHLLGPALHHRRQRSRRIGTYADSRVNPAELPRSEWRRMRAGRKIFAPLLQRAVLRVFGGPAFRLRRRGADRWHADPGLSYGPDMDLPGLSGPTWQVCQNAASFEYFSRMASAPPKRSSKVGMLPGFSV